MLVKGFRIVGGYFSKQKLQARARVAAVSVSGAVTSASCLPGAPLVAAGGHVTRRCRRDPCHCYSVPGNL